MHAYASGGCPARGGVSASDRVRRIRRGRRHLSLARGRRDARAALARAGGRRRDRRGNGEPRAGRRPRVVPRRRQPGRGLAAADGARLGRASARGTTVPGVDGAARAHRRARRGRGGRDTHLRRAPPSPRARHVLASGRARGREGARAGARERGGVGRRSRARPRRSRAGVRDADARVGRRQALEADDEDGRRTRPSFATRSRARCGRRSRSW